MSTRFVSNAVVSLLGGVVVVLSMGLSSWVAVRWSAFGIAIGIVGISVLAQLDQRRGTVQRALDVGLVLTAGMLIAATAFFSGTTVVWLAFALALGCVGVGFAGLTVHEVEMWRATHELGRLHWLAPRAERGGEETAGPRAA